MSFDIKRGDTLPILEGVVKDDKGNPLDLGGCTVTFAVRKVGKTVALIDAPATIVNAAAPVGDPDRGRVQYIWRTGDTGTLLGAGSFEGEFQVRQADATKIGTAPGDGYIDIQVLADIAAPRT